MFRTYLVKVYVFGKTMRSCDAIMWPFGTTVVVDGIVCCRCKANKATVKLSTHRCTIEYVLPRHVAAM